MKMKRAVIPKKYDYYESILSIIIFIDETDHIYAVCPRCEYAMDYVDYWDSNASIDLVFACDNCKVIGQRKVTKHTRFNQKWLDCWCKHNLKCKQR